MLQKIIRVGHSAAVTLPKNFLNRAHLHIGQEVAVETNDALGVVIVKPKEQLKNRLMNPEFQDWLKEFTLKHKGLLKKLARL